MTELKHCYNFWEIERKVALKLLCLLHFSGKVICELSVLLFMFAKRIFEALLRR